MKKPSSITNRAWRILRLALLWARKGGAFKRGLMFNSRMLIKKIVHHEGSSNKRVDHISYFEREFSFDKTPLFEFNAHSKRHLKMPCINAPSVDDGGDDDWIYCKCESRREVEEEREEEEVEGVGEICEMVDQVASEHQEEQMDQIDLKAEEFIERFHKQMRMQRQISLLQYHEMLRRGT